MHEKVTPTSEKAHMLRCAASLVVATYAKHVRITPLVLRALPLEHFAKSSK
jgi:hypothetical protein